MAKRIETTVAEDAPSSSALVKRSESAMAVAEGADAKDTRGKENIGREDIVLPRLAIAQSLSKQLKRSESVYIPGLEEGDLFNTVTGEKYGTGPLNFAVLRLDKRAIQFGPNNTVVDFDVPWNDERCEFTTDGDGKRVKPIADRVYDYIVILVDTLDIVVLSLKRSQIAAAKKLNALLALRPGAAWMGQYQVSTVIENKNSYSYGNYRITLGGPTPKEVVAFANDAYERLKTSNVKVDRTGEAEEVASGEVVNDDSPF